MGLMAYYYSVSSIFLKTFPEHDWEVWRFDHVPQGYWDDIQNQRRYMDWLSEQLKISYKTDW
jgi:hypothetical protein